MRMRRKFLLYLILMLTFVVTFSQGDTQNQITIFQKKNEPAKLKIGVTKLKTKELEMEFSKEKKLIYAELPQMIDDNYIIFVSEKLDEMPSVSTTNGRRSINNIKKYLTKDIKISPKFQYKIIVGDGENGIEKGKKYLLINCKTILSSVYIYIVEKNSYYVKEIYKGKFNLIENEGELRIVLKNPAMYFENETKIVYGGSGNIYVDSENPNGYSEGKGNHNTNQDSQVWWEIDGRISYPKVDEYEYEISDNRNFLSRGTTAINNGIKVGIQEKNGKYRLVTTIDKATFKFGNKTTSIFYLRWKRRDQVIWEKTEVIQVKIDDFNPTYYGKIYSAQGPDDTSKNNYRTINDVGTGYEKLKNIDDTANYYIDLDTIYRDYQRYAGVIKLIDNGNLSNFKIKSLDKVVAKSQDGSEIRGKVVFKELNNSLKNSNYLHEVELKPNENINEPLKEPLKYKLYFEISAEEYKKLRDKTLYELYSGDSKDILEIGFMNKEAPYRKKLNLNKPLNFKTSSSPFEIITSNLDFGTINLAFNRDKVLRKHVNTKIILRGKNIDNLELTLKGNEIDEEGNHKIKIKKYEENGIVENEKFLEVNRLKLDRIDRKSQEVREEQIKIYNLGGNLVVPVNSSIGKYKGEIYIDTTVIF